MGLLILDRMEQEGIADSSWEYHTQNIRAHQEGGKATSLKLTIISSTQPTQKPTQKPDLSQNN